MYTRLAQGFSQNEKEGQQIFGIASVKLKIIDGFRRNELFDAILGLGDWSARTRTFVLAVAVASFSVTWVPFSRFGNPDQSYCHGGDRI
jgi:hypothetical protein